MGLFKRNCEFELALLDGRSMRCPTCHGPEACDSSAICPNRSAASDPKAGVLTKELLDASFAAIAKQGSTPRHDCRFDGHVLVFNPFGFAACMYCGASEVETARPE